MGDDVQLLDFFFLLFMCIHLGFSCSPTHSAKSFLMKSLQVCKCSPASGTILSIIRVFNFLKPFLKTPYFCKISQEPTYFNPEEYDPIIYRTKPTVSERRTC